MRQFVSARVHQRSRFDAHAYDYAYQPYLQAVLQYVLRVLALVLLGVSYSYE